MGSFRIPGSVTAISFDIWGTWLGGNINFTRPRLRLIFDMLGYPVQDIEKVFQAYVNADKFYNSEAEVTQLDYGLRERLVAMLEELGISASVPDNEALRAVQAEVAKLRLRPECMPPLLESDLLDTLTTLTNTGYTLGVLSNTGIDNEQVMHQVLAALGLDKVLSVQLYSCVDGRAKPNPGLFHRMAEELGAQPHQVLHVGDNPKADCLAVNAGLHVVQYAPKGAPEGSPYPVITTMRELLR